MQPSLRIQRFKDTSAGTNGASWASSTPSSKRQGAKAKLVSPPINPSIPGTSQRDLSAQFGANINHAFSKTYSHVSSSRTSKTWGGSQGYGDLSSAKAQLHLSSHVIVKDPLPYLFGNQTASHAARLPNNERTSSLRDIDHHLPNLPANYYLSRPFAKEHTLRHYDLSKRETQAIPPLTKPPANPELASSTAPVQVSFLTMEKISQRLVALQQLQAQYEAEEQEQDKVDSAVVVTPTADNNSKPFVSQFRSASSSTLSTISIRTASSDLSSPYTTGLSYSPLLGSGYIVNIKSGPGFTENPEPITIKMPLNLARQSGTIRHILSSCGTIYNLRSPTVPIIKLLLQQISGKLKHRLLILPASRLRFFWKFTNI